MSVAMRLRLVSALTSVATAAALLGCGGDIDEATDRTRTAAPAERSRTGDAAKRLRRMDPAQTPVSPVVAARAPGLSLTHCPETGPGGYDVRVTGISCDHGSELLLGVGPNFDGYRVTQEKAYRPSRSDIAHVPEAEGWTCWSRYDKTSATKPVGEIHVICWEDAGLLLFKIG
jgi:hypothetical protein